MGKEEIIKYLKDNLQLKSKTEGPRYGMSGYTTISLVLEDEEISEITIDHYELEE